MEKNLTPRKRFNCVINHQEPDHVPLDLAGTSLTGISQSVVEQLKQLLGIKGEPITPYKPIDERILTALDIDFRRVGRLIASGDRPIKSKNDTLMDMWGVERIWTGQYWDIVGTPLRGLDISDLDSYPWPDPIKWIDDVELESFRIEAKRLWQETDKVVVAEHPVYGVLELACWMCGFDDFLWRLAGDKPFVHRLFSILLELQKRFIEPYYKALGEYIHLTTSGDDFGTQIGPFLSPKSFKELIKPYFYERIAFTKQFTPALFWHHSCGSIVEIIPDLIDCGVEILNPIQPGASGMDPKNLKEKFGNQISFHGGFDTQNKLPFGSPEEIEEEVLRVMKALKPGGGYIFSAAHNIQDDVKAENVMVMYEAAKKFGKY